MEIELLCALRGHVDVPTTFTFLCRYVRAGFFNKCMVQMACYIAEKCLVVYELLTYLPSLVAAGCVYIAQEVYALNCTNNTSPAANLCKWSSTLVHYTGYTLEDVKPCVDAIRFYCFSDNKAFDLSDSCSLSSLSTVSPSSNSSSITSSNDSGNLSQIGFRPDCHVVSPTHMSNPHEGAFTVVNKKHSTIQNGSVSKLQYFF